MLHAILVDSMIEKLEGTPEYADAEIQRRQNAGHSSVYLFAAANDEDFERKRQLRPLRPRKSAAGH